MNEYNLEFNYNYIDTDNFKQKSANILVSTIAGSRLNDYMKFSAWAHIDFNDEDKLHKYPHITELDKFSRSKTNCIIYDLVSNPYNNDNIYDKCFIYRSNNSKDSTYGFIMYNTITGKSSHIFYIIEIYDALCVRLIQFFNTLSKKHLFDYYNHRFYCCNNQYGLTLNDCPSLIDYNNIIDNYNKKISNTI